MKCNPDCVSWIINRRFYYTVETDKDIKTKKSWSNQHEIGSCSISGFVVVNLHMVNDPPECQRRRGTRCTLVILCSRKLQFFLPIEYKSLWRLQLDSLAECISLHFYYKLTNRRSLCSLYARYHFKLVKSPGFIDYSRVALSVSHTHHCLLRLVTWVHMETWFNNELEVQVLLI